MGYDLNRFVREVDEEFLCPICTMVLENSVQSQHCEHTFCYECIKEWLNVNNICPVDRRDLNLKQIKPIPRILNNPLLKFEIKCDFEPQGCDAVIKIENIKPHLETCEFNPNAIITCENECGLEMTRTESVSHNCIRKLASVVVAQNMRILYLEGELKKHSWYSVNGISVHLNSIQCNNTNFSDNHRDGIAQYYYPLSESNHYFEMEIIDMGKIGPLGFCYINVMSLGISRLRINNYNSSTAPKGIYYNGSIGVAYIFIVGGQQTIELGSIPKWKNGDRIGCGVKFDKQADTLGQQSLVYFTCNSQTVFEKSLNLKEFGLYPTFYTNKVGAKVIASLI